MKPATKDAVYARDKNQCAKCGSPKNLTIDHKIPLDIGGTDDLDNLQLLCARCNHDKGNVPDFRIRLKQLLNGFWYRVKLELQGRVAANYARMLQLERDLKSQIQVVQKENQTIRTQIIKTQNELGLQQSLITNLKLEQEELKKYLKIQWVEEITKEFRKIQDEAKTKR